MTLKEMSFVNYPLLSSASLHTHTGAATPVLRLSFAAQFANACLATQGVMARYIDRFSVTNARDGLRIIMIEQNPSPDGCPEIYQPQQKMFSIDMSRDAPIKQILLLNYFAPQHTWQSDHQITMLAVDRAIARKSPTQHQPLILQRLGATTTLLALSNITIKSDVGTASMPRYVIAFDVHFANRCEADNGIEVRLIESRSNPSAPASQMMYDWLLVMQRNGATRCDKTAQPFARHFTLQRDLHPYYKRQLLVLNPLTPMATTPTKPFHALNVWPGTS